MRVKHFFGLIIMDGQTVVSNPGVPEISYKRVCPYYTLLHYTCTRRSHSQTVRGYFVPVVKISCTQPRCKTNSELYTRFLCKIFGVQNKSIIFVRRWLLHNTGVSCEVARDKSRAGSRSRFFLSHANHPALPAAHAHIRFCSFNRDM